MSKLIKPLSLLFLILFPLACASPPESRGIITAEVEYAPALGARGYLARPEVPGSYPALILIHEWWGLNDHIRDNARRFASLGYVALAVDLYYGKTARTPDEARALASSVSENLPRASSNLEAAVTYLKKMEGVDPQRVGSVGWCFGGGWSYEMAKNDMGVKATVMYYGRFSPADDFSHMRATILGNFGEEDRSISVDSVKEFQATLKTLSGEHEIYIYPNAGHAFANDSSESYVEEAAELAWKRTLKFLNKHLGTSETD